MAEFSAGEPDWLVHALSWLGVSERPGRAADPGIIAFYRDAGHPEVSDDSVAWCAAFAGACLARSGIAPTGSLRARSYLDWGRPLDVPRRGAVVVLSRGSNRALGHVGFLVEARGDKVLILGGNQGDKVSVAAFPRSRVLGYRWPEATISLNRADGFEGALAHVLGLEGGYSDDPADPGGPTYRGITLSTFAAHRSEVLDASSRVRLTRQLRQLSETEIAAIYRQRYWLRASCHLLPEPIALMHFDAAVNQGPGRAIKMLQASVGAVIDGEVGPETLGKCRRADPIATIERYAEARRDAYRRLSTFGRFGRGWLNRVEKTRKAALRLAQSTPSTPKPKDPTTMQTKPQLQKTKWWGTSITLWGVLITALTAVLPALAPLFGLEISTELAEGIGRELTNLAQGGGGLLGTAIAIYGRLRARGPLIRKRLAMTL